MIYPRVLMASIKDKLAAGDLVRLFSVGRVVHPMIIDLFGFAGGYDGFWLDQEHGGLSYEQVLSATAYGRANGFDTFVRMAPTDYATVTQNLEAGTGGVLAARIESAEEAEQFVQWAKFGPRGVRGMNSSGFDGHYTFKTQAQFAKDANQDNLVGIQIEMLGALEAVEKIAAIDGVDFLFVGPSDLSQAMGHLGQLGHEDVWSAIERTSAACRQNGISWGTIAVNPEFVKRALENDCRMLIAGGDVLSLRRGIEATKDMFPDIFAG